MLNLGRNYYSLDIPVTYTYFNPKSGIDISLTAGLMVNWRNPDTDIAPAGASRKVRRNSQGLSAGNWRLTERRSEL